MKLFVMACTAMIVAIDAQSMIDESSCGILYDCWILQDGTKIAWRKSEGDDWVDIQMSRSDSGDYNTPQFMSVGFSQDQQMGSDAVTECVFTGDQATAHLSWNTGKSNKRLPSDIIQSHLELVASRRSQGDLYCRVRQRIEPAADIGGVIPLSFPYYLLAAVGTAKADGINIHDFTDNLPAVYTEQVNLAGKTFSAPLSVDPVAPVTINGMPPHPPLPPNGNLPVVGNPTGGSNPATRPPPALPGNSIQPEPESEPETESESEPEGVSEHDGHAEPESEPETNTIDDNRTNQQQRGSRSGQENSATMTSVGAVVGSLALAMAMM